MNEILEILNRLNEEFPIGNGRNHCAVKKLKDEYLSIYFWVAGETPEEDEQHYVILDDYQGVDILFEELHSYVDSLKNDN